MTALKKRKRWPISESVSGEGNGENRGGSVRRRSPAVEWFWGGHMRWENPLDTAWVSPLGAWWPELAVRIIWGAAATAPYQIGLLAYWMHVVLCG